MLRYRERTLKWTDPPVEHKVTDIRLFSGNEEKIMLEFKPVLVRPGDEVMVGDWDYYDSFMIYQTDYDKLLTAELEAVFPVMDPDPHGWGLQELFDPCSDNWFGTEDWQRLIDRLTVCFDNAVEPEKEFYYAVLLRMRRFMEISTMFCIEGNL